MFSAKFYSGKDYGLSNKEKEDLLHSLNSSDNESESDDESECDSELKKFIIGKNGDISHKTTSSLGLDFSFELVRGLDDDRIKKRVEEIILTGDVNQIVDLFVLLFSTRNCRGGKGEKDLFVKMFLALYKHFPKTCTDLLKIIPDYGYWKDLITIAETCGKLGTYEGIVFDNLSNVQRSSLPRSSLPRRRFTKIIPSKEFLQDVTITVLGEKIVEDWKSYIRSSLSDISLAAKWAPREKGHFAKKHSISFTKLINVVSLGCPDVIPTKVPNSNEKIYRKVISTLTKSLDVAEVKMCDGKYSEIDYKKIPSVSLNKFRKAHLNEDLKKSVTTHERNFGNRFPKNLDRVMGRKNLLATVREKKVKGGQIQPHEIVSAYNYKSSNIHLNSINGEDPSLDEKELLQAQWDDLRSKIIMKGGRKLLPIADVSGSMADENKNVKPIAVCVALSILLSEINHPAFSDRVITFSENPKWVDLSTAKTLEEKIITVCDDKSNAQNTDLIKVFELILDVAKKNNLDSEDIPDLVIFSDMQFDNAISSRYERSKKSSIISTFNVIDDMFREEGLIRPRIIYWNLDDKEGTPVDGSTPNTVLLSGYSQSLFKYLLFEEEIEQISPLVIYRRMIDDTMYDPVRLKLSASNEGVLSTYNFTVSA